MAFKYSLAWRDRIRTEDRLHRGRPERFLKEWEIPRMGVIKGLTRHIYCCSMNTARSWRNSSRNKEYVSEKFPHIGYGYMGAFKYHRLKLE